MPRDNFIDSVKNHEVSYIALANSVIISDCSQK